MNYTPSNLNNLSSRQPFLEADHSTSPGFFLQAPVSGSFHRARFSSRLLGYTLIELLCVIGVIGLMAVLVTPAINGMMGAGGVNNAAYNLAGTLDSAATYARAANTYVWVGFYEEDGSMASTNPPNSGYGRLVIGTVYSVDGTQIINPSGSAQTIPAARLAQLGKLLKVQNMHFADVATPSSPLSDGSGVTWDTRPSVGSGSSACRIGQSTPSSTNFPFQLGNYTFSKVIQFGPDGIAVMNSSLTISPWIEIGLQPARGNVVDMLTPNLVALQAAGINSHVRIYRK